MKELFGVTVADHVNSTGGAGRPAARSPVH